MPKRLTQEEYLKKIKLVHGNRYDYSLVEYIGNHNKIKIICPKHGIFKQAATMHLTQKQGCPEYKGVKKLTTEKFIKKAEIIHDYKYDYSLVDYKNNASNIIIICPKHGEFEQTPNRHLSQKSGCPVCNESKGEKEIAKILENNIKLIHIKYDENIGDKLSCVKISL